ncbi:MAG: NUDIX hydrolase [Actinobacteria bacterium]|nr:NUDIX hydrolase [Actinomycetota bacterium]
MTGFRSRAERLVAKASFLDLIEEDMETPDGEVLTRYTVRHPGAVAIVAFDDDGRLALVRQYRIAARRPLLEIPAGKREPGESPEFTAARELEEEIGVRAGGLVQLAEFYNSPGFCDEYTHVFLAQSLTPGAVDPDAKAEERHMEVVWAPPEEVDHLMATGEILDAKTIIGFELARRRQAGTNDGHISG